MKMILRLEFSNLFPEEERKDISYYLTNIPQTLLLKVIGFCTTTDLPNFDNFFSSPEMQYDINKRVRTFSLKRKLSGYPDAIYGVVSQLASLKLAEIILSKEDSVTTNTETVDLFQQELHLFKAFLMINEALNAQQNQHFDFSQSEDQLVDFMIKFSFPTADLSLFEGEDVPEFLKLLYATTKKVQLLFDFLDTEEDLKKLKQRLITSFSVPDEKEFLNQMKTLFFNLMQLKRNNSYLLKVTSEPEKQFLESMIAVKIDADEDFTYLKIHPLYKVDENVYSIVHHFFVIDKFYQSTRFALKDLFEADPAYKTKYGNFFGFFKKSFSEEYLMKKILDEIFHQSYLVKKPYNDPELPGEPDYYLRYQNTMFLFENKDVTLNKKIKASGNIPQLMDALKERFLLDGRKKVGIGQLVNSIKEIMDKVFRFDDDVNQKNNLKIYPVLLIHDRTFQCPGINHRLNSWYRKEVQSELKDLYNPGNIKDLTIIDIDTLIYWTPKLKVNPHNFRKILDTHLKQQKSNNRINTLNPQRANMLAEQQLLRRTMPISFRNVNYHIPIQEIAQILSPKA